MSECEHVELLKTYQYDRQKNITGEYWICVGCKLRFVPMGLAEAENAALKRENGALIEWGKAIMAEANPLILLHQARNPNNQTPLPRCAETWKNLPENIQALLTAEEQEDE